MNAIDIIVAALLIYNAYRGWQKGIFKSLLAPISFVVCFMLGIVYFQKTHNVLYSFAISIIGPIAITFFVSAFMNLRQSMSHGKIQLDPASRALGGVISAGWSMVMISLILIVVIIGPFYQHPASILREQIQHAFVFSLLKPVIDQTPLLAQAEVTSVLDLPPQKQQATTNDHGQNNQQVQDVLNDERIQALYSDPEIQELIKEKDYVKLMQSEKFAKILEDPQLVAKLLQLKSKLAEAQNHE